MQICNRNAHLRNVLWNEVLWNINDVRHPSFCKRLSEAIWWPASPQFGKMQHAKAPTASKCFGVPRNCKDMDLLLALQLATSEANNVLNRGSSRQSSHKVIHASHRSQIAAASQRHRRETYRQEMTRAWLARLLQIRALRDSCLRKQTQRKTAIMVPQEALPHSYGAIGASESNFLRYRANSKK